MFTMTTLGPGRLSTMARPRGGDWLDDEMASLRRAGTYLLVCMMTASELRELDLAGEAAAAEAAGIRFMGLPTPDRGTLDVQQFRTLVAELVDELAGGKHLVVHYRMGIGRSSLVAAGVLVAQGMPAPDAWAAISDPEGLRCRTLPNNAAGLKRPWRSADHRPLRPRRRMPGSLHHTCTTTEWHLRSRGTISVT